MFLLLFAIPNLCVGQKVCYQDLFHGGVTGNAFNPWYWNVSGNIEISIEPGSSIRKAYLFISIYNNPNERTIYFNGVPLIVNESLSVGNEYFFIYNSNVWKVRTIMYDVTSLIDPTQNTYSIVPPPNQPPPSSGGFYTEFYLYVAYENPSLSLVNTFIAFNDIQPQENMIYIIDELNTMDLSKNIGLALHSSHICDTVQDGSYVFIDANLIGLIGGDDDHSPVPCNGVIGSFYFQNDVFFGIGNDVPNSTMEGNDAIANLESYLVTNNSINLTVDYQSSWGPQTNLINQLFLTYTTPCDTFSVSVPNDTTICTGEVLQLIASGGQSYEWSASNPSALNDLSCTDCPNPIFSGETSRFYTVRIWNNDSCSVVRPVKINVRPRPLFGVITTTPSECGASTGSVSVSVSAGTASPVSFTLNDTLSQSSGLFPNLAAGSYTLSYTDGNDCVSLDTVVTVSEVSSTVAQFTVSPSYGTVPLEVNLTNISQNASDFLWSVNGTGMGAILETYTCDPSGVYTIELIAWQYDPSCADTFSLSVTAVDRLIIPTAFTPDGDGVNDFWELPNIDVIYSENSVIIFNRWGSVVYESDQGKYALNPWKGDYKGKPLPVGTYYFIIKVDKDEEHDLKGSVTVVR